MSVVMLRCTCKHEYQDRKYGKGVRVHNRGQNLDKASCTVCSKKKEGKLHDVA